MMTKTSLACCLGKLKAERVSAMSNSSHNLGVWEADLFGLLRVRCEGRSADHFGTRQTALLLAFLATFPRRHPRDEMVDLLWPDADPDSGRHWLSQAIWRLRQTLTDLCPEPAREVLISEVLISDRSTVALDPALLTTDTQRFRALLAQNALEEAVAVYGDSGGFLSGFYDDWVLAERQKLLGELLGALQTLALSAGETGDWPRAVRYAEQAVAADPLLEDSHRTLIRLLASSGQLAAAQRHYAALSRLLVRELNAEPSGATRALIAQIQTQADTVPTPPAAPAAGMPVPALQVLPLPVLLTTFHGRDVLLAELQALLQTPSARLVTLLGTGGIGKTRLALELARRVAAQNAGPPPSVAFVPLAEVTDPALLADAVAGALSSLRDGPPLPRITAALLSLPASAPFLLVLDNAEHLAAETGALAAKLLAQVPHLRVLVTSQRSLGAYGEQEIMLAPLGLPGDAPALAPSVQLFLDRARSVRPSFPTDGASLADVAQICTRLEGLPLAIELCAGWAQTLGTRQMLEMLARRFELLVSRRTDIPARHRTLRAAIEYSYMQLSEPMQEFFVQLAVFRGGWTLAAAAAVCTGGSVPAALAMLAQMRERSLLVADEARAGGGMRYTLLESLRDFALEQRTLAQAREHTDAHAAYFARFVSETTARMHGAEDALWAVRLEDETENIRAALEFLLSRPDPLPACTAIAAAAAAWNAHGHAREAREWTARALALSSSDDLLPLRARLLTIQAEARRLLSDYAEAAASAGLALSLWRQLGDAAGMTECISLLGITAMLNDDFDRAQTLLEEALPAARLLGDRTLLAQVWNDLGRVALARQDWQTASARLSKGLNLRRQIGDPRMVCSSLNNLALVALYQGQYAAARTLLREGLALQSQHQFIWQNSLSFNSAVVERMDGHFPEALRLLSIAVGLSVSHGERRMLAWCVKEAGHLAAALGLHALCLCLLSCAETQRVSIGMSFKPLGPSEIARDQSAAVLALGAADAAAYTALGADADPETLLASAQVEIAASL